MTEFSEVALAQHDDVRLPAMTNIHYAKIGDVWKHLPLAEVLSIERPGRYWVSHFGHDGELCMECARREGVL